MVLSIGYKDIDREEDNGIGKDSLSGILNIPANVKTVF
jgi:hypothetical protein